MAWLFGQLIIPNYLHISWNFSILIVSSVTF